MTGVLNLEQMLLQLQHAYLAALQVADEQEASRLRRYFREDGTPYVQTICIPNQHDEKTRRKIDVPVYVLLSASSLRVKELTIEFEGKLEGLAGFEMTSPETSKTSGRKPRSRRQKARSETAHVRITLKSSPSGRGSGESDAPAHNQKVGVDVDVTIVYPGEVLHSNKIPG